jgi:hypothetical protein
VIKPFLSTDAPETVSLEIAKELDPKHVSETKLFIKLMSISVPVP